MAYRQLCIVTFAMLGLWLPACGSGDVAGEVDPPKSDQPPASGDQAPPTSDRPPGNPDQPPGNPDQPPGNPDQPPGVQPGEPSPTWEDECDELCEDYGDPQECDASSVSGALVRTICNHGCSVKQGEESCEATFVTAVSCVVGLGGLCTEQGPSAAAAMTCQQAVSAAQACVLAAEPGGGDTCTPAGQCECADTCASCKCSLGNDSSVCASFCD